MKTLLNWRAAGAEADAARRAQLLHRLGDAYRERLADPARATQCYRGALESDPRNEGARAGLHALLSDPTCAPAAVEALAVAYAATDADSACKRVTPGSKARGDGHRALRGSGLSSTR